MFEYAAVRLGHVAQKRGKYCGEIVIETFGDYFLRVFYH